MAFKTDYDFDAEKIAYRLRHKSAEDVASDHRRQVRVAAEDRLRRIQEQDHVEIPARLVKWGCTELVRFS